MSPFQATVSFPYASWASLGFKTLLLAHQKNVAALSNVNQVAFEGMTTLLQRQAILLNATVEECSRGMNDVLAAASLEAKASRQADTTRHAYESTAARFRELFELAAKTHAASVDILNTRLAESLDELTALFAAPAAPASPAPAAERSPDIMETAALVAVPSPVEPAPGSAEEASLADAEPALSIEEPAEDEEANEPTAPRPNPKPRGPRTTGGPAIRASRRPPSRR